ncbi:hypothetical protein [Enterocloster hominis (ex Hitch et al. 2024)]|uniref:Uncharacterized protein n=1 Tax=Enterocloster hominis (ex Hitch et al. 2024) TaxID=1917870 RepID=A0ABV1D8A0_9FIRM
MGRIRMRKDFTRGNPMIYASDTNSSDRPDVGTIAAGLNNISY